MKLQDIQRHSGQHRLDLIGRGIDKKPDPCHKRGHGVQDGPRGIDIDMTRTRPIKHKTDGIGAGRGRGRGVRGPRNPANLHTRRHRALECIRGMAPDLSLRRLIGLEMRPKQRL